MKQLIILMLLVMVIVKSKDADIEVTFKEKYGPFYTYKNVTVVTLKDGVYYITSMEGCVATFSKNLGNIVKWKKKNAKTEVEITY